MRYIQKIGTPSEAKGKKATKKIVADSWCIDTKRYHNLCYDRSRMQNLATILIEEQSDRNGNSYCCYCMRKLFLKDTDDGHQENVTFEHIVPQNIKSADWIRDKKQYCKFSNLDKCHIIICYDGTLTEAQKTTEMKSTPYPHFISYHNIVASCDGSTFEHEKTQKSRCCNNKRQERFVMPLFLSKAMVAGIIYTSKGELDYDDSKYDCSWFDENHLRLTNTWITLVRRIWYKISKSEYSDLDVEKAINDRELRQNIIDDIDSNDEILSWNENDSAWRLFSEYSWFYLYYKVRQKGKLKLQRKNKRKRKKVR